MPTSPRPAVRRVQPIEYADVGELTVAGYRADGLLEQEPQVGPSIDHHYTPRLRDTATRDAEAEVWVAVDGDQILGTVTWCPPGSPWREIATRSDQGEFRMLAVPPAHRGAGVAKALVAACLERARADRMREILLSSQPQMVAAQRLYRSFGFSRAPEFDHRPIPSVQLWAFRLDFPAISG